MNTVPDIKSDFLTTILDMISGQEADKPAEIERLANEAKHKSRKKITQNK